LLWMGVEAAKLNAVFLPVGKIQCIFGADKIIISMSDGFEHWLEMARRPEHLHLMINHLPLVGLVVAALFLAAATALRNQAAARIGLVGVALLALSAWPVVWSGDAGADNVYDLLDDDGVEFLKTHRHLAEKWLWMYFATAVLAGGVGAASWKWPKILLPGALLTVLAAAACLWVGAQTAEAGGKIRHPEFRRKILKPSDSSRAAGDMLLAGENRQARFFG